MRFKVGDKVIRISDNHQGMKIGDVGTVSHVDHQGSVRLLEFGGDDNSVWHNARNLKVFTPIPLRSRIEALNDGWNKEADDILKTIILALNLTHALSIEIVHFGLSTEKGEVRIVCGEWPERPSHGNDWNYKSDFSSSCSKNQAFKEALLWLLEKSGLEEPKENDLAEVDIKGQKWEAKLVRKI